MSATGSKIKLGSGLTLIVTEFGFPEQFNKNAVAEYWVVFVGQTVIVCGELLVICPVLHWT